ncbi:MAG TPA: response regulator transcription factor [Caulobacterales bacterium]|jgi:two-component system KDP operon response regulator KdpE|nr:response regulator transcription factor [Caulobacterales bacterium]
MTAASPKALIIDDEKAIRRFVRSVLVAEDFTVDEAFDLASAREAIAASKPDLVILDLDLPDGDGSELIPQLLTDGPAILVLSAYDEESRKVAALDAGAHDFVTKPFGVKEFMARVRAAMRHRLHEQGAPAVYDDGRLKVDLPRHQVLIEGRDPKLTPREFEILRLLLIAGGRVLTHRQLIERLWGKTQNVDVQTLRVHVRNLRQKIEADGESPTTVLTEPGVGYRFGL